MNAEESTFGRFDGRVAIVTGAARGQGEAEARLFAERGARVLICDVLEEEGRAVASDVGANALFHRLDVSDAAAWAGAIDTARKRFGPVTILVNNAAITQLGPLSEISLVEFQRVVEVNQLSVLLGMQAVFPMMRGVGGSIVNTASAAALSGAEFQAVYSGTKAAIRSMTRVAAKEWARFGIRVNCILPGAIDTPMLWGPHTVGVDLDLLLSGVPLGRPGKPIEIARAACFLASDEASYITGADLLVDGGISACLTIPLSRS